MLQKKSVEQTLSMMKLKFEKNFSDVNKFQHFEISKWERLKNQKIII